MSAPSDDLIGRQLDEYRLETVLGVGGMARVYRGLDVRLNRHAAIKVIETSLRADPEYVMRFKREAQAIAQLEHPNIVRLYRYGEAEGLLYMAMEYIQGADLEFVLSSYHQDGEFISPEDAGRIIREVCLALDYAHGKGVVHRDIKPANILLDAQGRAILSDFGLALLVEVGTRGEVFGSPHYIAPEQAISSAKAVPQSDLYSVGVILYEMFTGQVPFEAKEPMDVALLHMSEPPRPPRELRPEISPGVEAVILKALEKNPKDRYPNGAALAEALERALHGNPGGSALAPTLTRATIPERVAGQIAHHPLPPVPAAVAASPAAPPWALKRTLAFACLSAVVGIVAVAIIFLLATTWFASGFFRNGASMTSRTPTAGASAQATTAIPARLTATALAQLASPQVEPSSMTATGQAATQAAAALGATASAASTLPSTSTPTPVPTATPEVYSLAIVRGSDDSLFVINHAPATFPLTPLRLGDGKGAISGTEWDVDEDRLGQGECVIALKDKSQGNPGLPGDQTCRPVGDRLTRKKPERFWNNSFNVYYGEAKLGTCDKDQQVCQFDWSAK